MEGKEIEVQLLPRRKDGDVIVAGLQMFNPDGSRISLNPWVIAGPTWNQDTTAEPMDIGPKLEFSSPSGLVMLHASLHVWGQVHVNLKLDDESYLGFIDVDEADAKMVSLTDAGLVMGASPDLANVGPILVVGTEPHSVQFSTPGSANGHVNRVVLAARSL